MHFGNPQVLWLLLLWPVLVLLGARTLVWRRRVAGRLGSPSLLERLYPASVRRWRVRRLILLALALLLLILAAARPQYGRVEQTVRAVGTNVIVAVDCSASMRARDVAPSRMEQAKQNLALLLRRLSGNRVGIVAFAGTAFLQCPMTLDRSMAMLVLESLDTDSVGVPGTDLGAAIRTATEAFENGAAHEGGRALILLTDGEDNEGKGLAAAREAAAKKVRIYAIGLGTERGAPLMDERGQFKEDAASGGKVNTRLDIDTLRQIAQATGGEAWAAGTSAAGAIEAAASQIEHLEKTQIEAQRQVLYQDRFQWFLAPALILVLAFMLSRPEAVRLTPPAAAPRPAPAPAASR